MTSLQHAYAVRPRKDHRGVNLISDALPFSRLWYGEPDAISNAVGYAKFFRTLGLLLRPQSLRFVFPAQGKFHRKNADHLSADTRNRQC